ncbi:MAG: hypothetical protein WC868_12805 [Bacteroidales bacterium]
MKKLLFIIITFIISSRFSYTQNSDTTSLHFHEDSILNKIITSIPKGWIVSTKNGEIIFEKTDSVLILNEDRYNTQNINKTKAERIERIKTHGIKGKSRLVLKYENRWTYEKILTVKNTNTYVYQEIKKLPEKYKIANLYDKTLSSRETAIYTGVTQKEKDQISKYEKEKKELLSNTIVLPNYNTEKYSFFTKSMSGYNDNTHDIYPEEASLQLFQILTLFIEYAGQ